MNLQTIITGLLCIVLCGRALAQAQDMDKELADLSEKLATAIKDQGKKKVAAIDFTDLQGGSSELGKYVAEQLTVNLVLGKRDFAVLDRANLRRILAEHKLTSDGLINPVNAKKLGEFAGVDALILGTVIPKNKNIALTAKIITTDTAEIVGAARAEFKMDDTVQQLFTKPATDNAGNVLEGPSVVKSFGDLRVELQPLNIVNGQQFLLTVVLVNQNAKKSLWVAVSCDPFGQSLKGAVTDSSGFECLSESRDVSGVATARFQNNGFDHATELKPSESITATIKFSIRSGRKAEPGPCRLQLEFLSGPEFAGGSGRAKVHNFVTKIEAH